MLSQLAVVISASLSVSSGVDEQPYRMGLAFFDAEGPSQNDRLSADIRLQADPAASKPMVSIFVRNNGQEYEIFAKNCPSIERLLAETSSLLPRTLSMPGGGLTAGFTRADGVKFRLEAPYSQADGGTGRVVLSSNNGALADWGHEFMDALEGCKSQS